MKKNQLKFCVGIIWFNPTPKDVKRLSIIEKCFDKVYIYDNSPVNNKKYLTDYFLSKKIEYFYNGKNEGISIPFNYIAKKAKNYDFLFALDQDTEIKENAIIDLKKYIRNHFNENVGIYCPNIYFKTEPKIDNLSDSIQNTITSCSMLNLDIFNKLGGYDNNIFLDGVDREYCFRLKKYGYKIIRVNNILIKQNLGNGKKNIFGIYEHAPIRTYYITYNKYYFIDKYPGYFKGWKRLKYLNLSNLKQELSIILFEKNKIRKLKLIKKAKDDYKYNKNERKN